MTSTVDELIGTLQEVLAPELGADVVVTDLQRLSAGANRETWSFDATAQGQLHPLIMQRERAGLERQAGTCAREARILVAAGAAGVPVAEVVTSADIPNPLERSFTINRRIEGETIARKLLRDDQWAGARDSFVVDCANALAGIHAIDIETLGHLDLPPASDALTNLRTVYQLLDDPHPAFDLGLRWLDLNRPPERPDALVHGDFRMGNLLLDTNGLAAALDWEITHFGNPIADLGWLCVRAWRFGSPHPVGGIGQYDELLAAYRDASGTDVSIDELRWWETFGTLRWGVICLQMAGDYRRGTTNSVEIATIGRRVAENEYDVLRLLPAELNADPGAP